MSVVNAKVQPTIFREYIGFKKVLTEFPDDIVNPSVDNFQFVLAFATEVYDESTKKGSGSFEPNWDISSFDVDSILQLKYKNPNVTVIISIGGHGSEFPFDPSDVTIKWINEAKKSLKDILNQFKDNWGRNIIDGIDVNYDTINNHENFMECLGTVIKSLKDEGIITVASISPSDKVRPDYKELYQMYGDYIDWVNYQFYYENVKNETDFINLYTNLALDYTKEKLLAGFSTDSKHEKNFSEKDFFDGLQNLLKRKLIPGVSVWDADSSKFPPNHENPFDVEILAQQLIVHYNRWF